MLLNYSPITRIACVIMQHPDNSSHCFEWTHLRYFTSEWSFLSGGPSGSPSAIPPQSSGCPWDPSRRKESQTKAADSTCHLWRQRGDTVKMELWWLAHRAKSPLVDLILPRGESFHTHLVIFVIAAGLGLILCQWQPQKHREHTVSKCKQWEQIRTLTAAINPPLVSH